MISVALATRVYMSKRENGHRAVILIAIGPGLSDVDICQAATSRHPRKLLWKLQWAAPVFVAHVFLFLHAEDEELLSF